MTKLSQDVLNLKPNAIVLAEFYHHASSSSGLRASGAYTHSARRIADRDSSPFVKSKNTQRYETTD